MDKYEIGFRLRGYPKDYLKALSCEIYKNLGKTLDKRIIPHLTYLRPFETNDENKVIEIFENTLSQFTNPITYKLEGFGTFNNKKKVVYGKVKQNPEIEEMIEKLESSLEKTIKFRHPKMKLPNEKESIILHSTIIDNLTEKEYLEIQKFFQKQQFDPIHQPMFRTYLLKNKRILREYDFYLNESLERFDAINPLKFQETTRAFEEKTKLFISPDLTIRNNFQF